MLKFFGRIRRKWIDEGNLRKYFFYAIGEVLLVVIGILIAIGINNYLNYQRDRKIEEQLLRRMLVDLNQDVKLMTEKKSSFETQKNAVNNTILALYNPEYPLIKKAKIIDAFLSNYINSRVEFRATTYRETENGNRFDIIINVKLREAIINYYNECVIFNLGRENLNDWILSMRKNFDVNTQIIKFSDLITEVFPDSYYLSPKNIEFLNNPSSEKFQLSETVILADAWYAKESIVALIEMEKKTNALISFIEQETRQRWGD